METEGTIGAGNKVSFFGFLRRLAFFAGTSALVFLAVSWLGRVVDCGPKDHDGQCALSSFLGDFAGIGASVTIFAVGAVFSTGRLVVELRPNANRSRTGLFMEGLRFAAQARVAARIDATPPTTE